MKARGLEFRANHDKGRRLRDYANEHSSLIYRPDIPTTIPYDSSAIPDVLDIVLNINLATPVYLTTCSALSSDNLPVLIDTRCRSSFLNIPDRPDFRRTDWVKFEACLEDRLRSTRKLRNGVEIDTCVEDVSSAIAEALAALTPRVTPVTNHDHYYRHVFRMIHA